MFLLSDSEWDTCAPHVIVEQAGGYVLSYEGSGERGIADVVPLLRQDAVSGGGGDGGDSRDDARTPRLDAARLSYNKEDLSSPRCLFVGNCTTK